MTREKEEVEMRKKKEIRNFKKPREREEIKNVDENRWKIYRV